MTLPWGYIIQNLYNSQQCLISSVKLIKFKSYVYLYHIFYSLSYTALFYFYQYPRYTEVDKGRLIRILNK